MTPRTVRATRYVTPLREGGSVPGLMEADDDGLYVVKLRAAAQGPRTLVAEMVAGRIGQALGLPVPELVLVDFDARLAAAEPDSELQEPLRASGGLNLGMDFLPGALAFDTATVADVDPDWAADVVWFDAALTNMDRTARNPNMVRWHGRTWLIDHGAALYLHHGGVPLAPLAARSFPAIADHVLLTQAGNMAAAQQRARRALSAADIDAALACVPDAWLDDPAGEYDAPTRRDDYRRYLLQRIFKVDVGADVEKCR